MLFLFRPKVKKIPRDEFIERILCTVPGMTPASNIYLMDKAIAHMPGDADVLEIGSFAGQSAILFHYLMRKHGKKGRIVCVDPFIYEGWQDSKSADKKYLEIVGNDPLLSRKDYLQFVEASFQRNVSFFCSANTPQLYKMNSDDFFARLQKGDFPELKAFKPGFCYIDGDHSKAAALSDAKNCLQLSVKGGWLLMDDTSKGSGLPSAEAAEEICSWKELELVDKNPNFLFRKY
jgi:hypothetical protein